MDCISGYRDRQENVEIMLYYKLILVMDFASIHIYLAHRDLERIIGGCQNTLYVT